ncbi:hydantoinase/oxoprolinase family protein [Streptomyces mirabilis]|uniref:hydantoinase/oxoprolinase family protein n=1 Tax=Streptomyces mirabilis TaxID=68239 RepID=UPI0036C671BA
MASEPRTGITRVGADIGGTFTDVAAVDAAGKLHIGKRLTTHGSEHDGVIQAVEDTGIDMSQPESILAHGTTLVINSLLEKKGARVALVTTAGFADVLDIGRGARAEIFTLRYHRDPPLVPAEMRFEIDERTLAGGGVESDPGEAELGALAAKLRLAEPEAVAVAFLHSYVSPGNEQKVGDYLRREFPSIPVTLSSDLSRQWREFERFTTAAANAYVAPVADRYLRRLTSGLEADGFRGDFIVLDSSGGAMEVTTATRQPVRAIESGPVGGVIGARSLARRHSIDNVVTFDMGGTTAKSALVEGGDYATRDLYWIGGEKRGFPLQVSTVDIIEVGVGGGSIAWLDDAGRLQVGPRSAGSQPGPACYGLGGTHATLTDANLYCGRLDKDHFAGNFTLDPDASRAVIEELAEQAGMSPDRLALGIIRLANLEVAATVRKQTLERGNDPREYTLLASGGGGPLHSSAIAQEVGIRTVLVPRFPGHYSALGMLEANLKVDRREVLTGRLRDLRTDELAGTINRIHGDLLAELGGDPEGDNPAITFRYALAIRFTGQEHALWIPAPEAGTDVPDNLPEQLRKSFETEYRRRYGHLDEMSDVETAELEVVAERALPPVEVDYDDLAADDTESHIRSLWNEDDGWSTTPVIPRSSLDPGDRVTGPAILHEIGSTTALPPLAVAEVLADGVLLVTVPQ